MPTYKVTDPTTGRMLKLTGDSPPTEQELETVFSSVKAEAPVKEEPSLWSKLSQRGRNMLTPDKTTSQLIPDPIHVAGETAGAFNDIMTAGGKALYRGMVPAPVRDIISEGTAEGTPVGDAARYVIRPWADAAKKVSEKYPVAARYVSDVGNVLAAVPMAKGLTGLPSLTGQGVNAGKDIIKNISDKSLQSMPDKMKLELLNKIDSDIRDRVQEGMAKGVRPTVKGKGKFGKVEKYTDNSTDAVENLIKNKNGNSFQREEGIINKKPTIVKGENPETLAEFSQVISEGIDNAVKKRKGLEAGAGSHVKINGAEASSIFDETIANTRLADETRAAAEKVKTLMANNPSMTPSQSAELLKTLNAHAKFYYSNPQPGSTAEMWELGAKQLRKEMINKLDAAGGEWQKAGREIRDLMAIEKDVNHRWTIDSRKNSFGFFDLSNVAVGAELADALLTQSPVALAKAGGITVAKKYMQYINSPNTQIKRMFADVEGLVNKRDSIKSMLPPSAAPVAAAPLKQLPYVPRMGGPEDISLSQEPPVSDRPKTRKAQTTAHPELVNQSSGARGIKGEYPDKARPRHLSDDVLNLQEYGNNAVDNLMRLNKGE
jgi:hypothetical protein